MTTDPDALTAAVAAAIDEFARAVNEDTFAYECGRGGDKQGVDASRTALLAAIRAEVAAARAEERAAILNLIDSEPYDYRDITEVAVVLGGLALDIKNRSRPIDGDPT